MKTILAGVLALVWGITVWGQDAERPATPTKAGQIVRFEVLIADLTEAMEAPSAAKILELDKAGKLTSLTRFQLTSLEEMPAVIQFGELAPRVSGRSTVAVPFRGRGGGAPAGPQVVPQYTSISVGTTLKVTARVIEEGIIVAQFYLDRTGLAGGPEGAFDPNDAKPPKPVERIVTDTTLRLKAGEPQVISGQQVGAGNEAARTWIVITAGLGAEAIQPAGKVKSP
jgi:hypothetical protein